MERVSRQYFCDICNEEITGKAFYKCKVTPLYQAVGVPAKSKAWSEVCKFCFQDMESSIQAIINSFCLYKKEGV